MKIVGNDLQVGMDWPKGTNLSTMAYALHQLQVGYFAKLITDAVVAAANENGEFASAQAVTSYLEGHLLHGPDVPSVQPLDAYRHLARSSL